jgi:two-component system, LytTR family, response regulator
MKINTVIADDEFLAIEQLQHYSSKYEQLDANTYFRNGIETLSFVQNNKVDLLLLDIEMPDMTGMEVIRALKNPPLIILTTAYSEFALEAYSYHVFDYLLKPITFDRFSDSIERAIQYFRKTELDVFIPPTFVMVKSDGKMIKINFDEINYLEGMREYVRIVTDKNKIMTLNTMKYFEEVLPQNKFVRIHKSFIVSIGKINHITGTDVEVGSKELPIGEFYKDKLLKALGLTNQ